MKRIVGCSLCGKPGHYAPRCPDPQADRAQRRPSASPGHQAAAYLAANGGTLAAAAKLHSVSKQAVQQAWRWLYGRQPTPEQSRRAGVAQQAVELARRGASATTIEGLVGYTRKSIVGACAKAGVPLEDARRPWDATEAAVAAVAGGSSIIDAAAEHGVAYRTVQRVASMRGVSPRVGVVRGKPGDGRADRAVALVLAGSTVAAACAAERVAPSAVRKRLAKRRSACTSGS